MSVATSNGVHRFTVSHPCPVCGGSDHDRRGQGHRCYGYLDSTGDYARCTREDRAGPLPRNPDDTYSHRLKGRCNCGEQHGPDDPQPRTPRGTLGRGTIDKVYQYRDEVGKVLYECVRKKNPKGFSQRRPDGNGGWIWSLDGVDRLPYRLPELLAADPSDVIWIVEGEKDAEALASRGMVATCNSEGAGKGRWRDNLSAYFRDRRVVIIPDNDQVGREHAQRVAQALHGVAASVRVVELTGLPEKGDVSDWLDAGGTVDRLREMAAATPEWASPAPALKPKGDYITGPSGTPKSCVTNAMTWLRLNGPTLEWDTFTDDVLVGGEVLSDSLITTLTSAMEVQWKTVVAEKHVERSIYAVARENAFSSLERYLTGLTWDGEPRIERFFQDFYGADDAQKDSYHRVVGRVLFISAVARALEPGCKVDTVPILIGNQGTGKSRGIAALCPSRTMFADEVGNIGADRAGENLRGKWIAELAELSRVNQATLESVKKFITCQADRYKVPYERTVRDFPRTNIFVGSTNDDTPLRDIENRRFLPVRIPPRTEAETNRAVELIEAARDQLWAEAVSRYKAGDKWWVTNSEVGDTIREEVGDARQQHPWEAILDERLRHIEEVTIQEAAPMVNITNDRLDRKVEMSLSAALKAIGFTRKQRPRPSRAWYYYRPCHQPQVGATGGW